MTQSQVLPGSRFSMKKVTSFLNRRTSSQSEVPQAANSGTPEGEIESGVRLFCESGGSGNSGEEVLHLPGIVEHAESSPSAAKHAAYIIRKFLSKDNAQRPYVQYNAVMLIRILTDHPGATFTRNIDPKFVATVKELLREGKDMSVQQILRETLDNFQLSKADDETLKPLIAMWAEYKAKMAKRAGYNPAVGSTQPGSAMPPNGGWPVVPIGGPHGRSRHELPPPHELASRIEEARTSAKLLTQMVQTTPNSEVIGHELLKEFADRCQSASRSIQGYIGAENPAPDADTSLTLIETNDQLSTALSKHQRAVLQARKAASRSPPPAANGAPAPAPAPESLGTALGPGASVVRGTPDPPSSGPPTLAIPRQQESLENPFDDAHRAPSQERREGAAHADEEEEESPQEERNYRF